jgi:hypothetical protein
MTVLDKLIEAKRDLAEARINSYIDILNESGKAVKFDPDNRELMDRLSGGQYTWRPKGSQGVGVSLAQTPQNPTREKVAEVQGTLRIEMDPAAQRAGTSSRSRPLPEVHRPRGAGAGSSLGCRPARR